MEHEKNPKRKKKDLNGFNPALKYYLPKGNDHLISIHWKQKTNMNEMNVVVVDTLKAVRNSCCRAISVARISDWI